MKFITILIIPFNLGMKVKAFYIVWVKVDESLPWIELKGIYGTRKAAKEAARELVGKATIKVVRVNAKAEGIRTLAAIGQKRAL